jgi:transposase-like protein
VSAVDVPPPVEEIKKLYLANLPIESITSRHGISRATLYRLIKR